MEKTVHDLKCRCGAKLGTIALPADLHPRFLEKRLHPAVKCAKCAGKADAHRAELTKKAPPSDPRAAVRAFVEAARAAEKGE